MAPFDFSFTPSRGPSRSEAASQGQEAVAILRSGSYATPQGPVDVSGRVARAIAQVRDYPPSEVVALPATPAVPRATVIHVVNGTSLASARALAAAQGDEPMVLNFASARKPGGGFLGGALAQEESLARSSALYGALEKSGMYHHHRNVVTDCIYTDWVIHSPGVPVFRDDETGALLGEPYDCAFLTAPAPNAGVVLPREPERAAEVRAVMASRITRVLAIAAQNGHSRLVLGAWGCGVFKNDPSHVAACFARELAGPFAGVFAEVVFAVLDWSPERRFIRPFVEHFEGA
jgi:uncharacterized protein (TIGR02452 family)